MSQYYRGKRKSGLYDPSKKKPFRLSRKRLALFLECPRCFYLDRRLGVDKPEGFPFKLNSAVDALLKKEFDIHRAKGTPHPLMKAYGIDAVPYRNQKLNHWRDALHGGIRYWHQPTNLMMTGGIDDVWVRPSGELHIVDYKATSKNGEVTLDADWQDTYKQQIEIYQWLFRANEFKVSDTAYFVYCNGRTDRKAFDGKLEFDVKIIPHQGNDNWVEPAIFKAHECLIAGEIPQPSQDCDYCRYVAAINKETVT